MRKRPGVRFLLLWSVTLLLSNTGPLHAQQPSGDKTKQEIAIELFRSFGGARITIDADQIQSSRAYVEKVEEFIDLKRVENRVVEAILKNHTKEELQIWLDLSRNPAGRSFLLKFSSSTRNLMIQVTNQELAHAIRCTSLALRPAVHKDLGAYTAEQMLQRCRQ